MFREPMATKLAELRIAARAKRRLTYDCMKAVVSGARVICAKGHKFPTPGFTEVTGVRLESVLRGRSSQVCQRCEDYDGEETQ